MRLAVSWWRTFPLAASMIVALVGSVPHAKAVDLQVKEYGQADGLRSLDVPCMLQSPDGSMLVCSERGVYVFDGHRFEPLGPAQGLRDGQVIYDLIRSLDGRFFVRYEDALYVSDVPTSPTASPWSLAFHEVYLGHALYSDQREQVVAYHDGAAIIVGDKILQVDFEHASTLQLKSIVVPPHVSDALNDFARLRSFDDQLWITMRSRGVCRLDTSAVRCFGPSQGLPAFDWHDIIKMDDGRLLARSSTHVAVIDPASGHVEVQNLPDQKGLSRYAIGHFGLFP